MEDEMDTSGKWVERRHKTLGMSCRSLLCGYAGVDSIHESGRGGDAGAAAASQAGTKQAQASPLEKDIAQLAIWASDAAQLVGN